MLTVNEYKAASRRTKLAYRLYRNPFVMFILGPIYVFLITNRFNKKGARRKERKHIPYESGNCGVGCCLLSDLWLAIVFTGARPYFSDLRFNRCMAVLCAAYI